jgi:hypothetical protein
VGKIKTIDEAVSVNKIQRFFGHKSIIATISDN